jgi:hypothetical protein
VSFGAPGAANLGNVNPEILAANKFATAATSDWRNNIIGVGSYIMQAIYTAKDPNTPGLINTLKKEFMIQIVHHDNIFASVSQLRDIYYRDDFPLILDARNSLNPNYHFSWEVQ